MHKAQLTGLALLLIAGQAAADPGRYQFERTEQGFVRLDTQTGAVALCAGEKLDCRETGSPGSASGVEIGRLEERLAALERRVEAMERSGSAEALPSDEEFDRTLGLMERFMRRFFGIIQEFNGEPDPQPSAPGRT